MSAVQANPYAGYQIVVAVDISGSMEEEEAIYDDQSRYDFVKHQIGHLVKQLLEFDQDGLDLVIFNHEVRVERNIKSHEMFKKIFSEIKPHGKTDTTGAINACYRIHQEYKNSENDLPKSERTFKSTMVLVLTDGVPNDESGLKSRLIEISREVNDQAEIGFSFLQVGTDKHAKRYLESLDDMTKDNPRLKNDIVDRKSFTEVCDHEGNLSIAKVLADCLND